MLRNTMQTVRFNPASNYLVEFNNRNTRRREISSKLTNQKVTTLKSPKCKTLRKWPNSWKCSVLSRFLNVQFCFVNLVRALIKNAPTLITRVTPFLRYWWTAHSQQASGGRRRCFFVFSLFAWGFLGGVASFKLHDIS